MAPSAPDGVARARRATSRARITGVLCATLLLAAAGPTSAAPTTTGPTASVGTTAPVPPAGTTGTTGATAPTPPKSDTAATPGSTVADPAAAEQAAAAQAAAAQQQAEAAAAAAAQEAAKAKGLVVHDPEPTKTWRDWIWLAIVGGILLAAAAAWGLVVASGRSERLAPVSHALGEAGWRIGARWSEFTDWLRIGSGR